MGTPIGGLIRRINRSVVLRHSARILPIFYLPIFQCCVASVPAHVDLPAPGAINVRLAEADRLASRGCYLCLKEAAAAYEALLHSPAADTLGQPLAAKALENYLMIALREDELRIPDSGARDAARQLQARVPSSYETYFAVLDAGPARSRDFVEALEAEWPASPMKAYFYLSTALSTARVKELKLQVEGILDTYPHDLSLKYRMQAFLPTFAEDEARTLIGEETGFGEVHFLIGQRAVLDARLEDAHRELSRARQLLPDSAAIVLVFANVKMAYARYEEALSLYDHVLTLAGTDADAQLGRARALSYLRRHAEAIALLDELLQNLRNSPGEKFYWRAWNRLRLGETRAAYEDAVAALNGMRNNEVYRLAGIAAFGIAQRTEARRYFDEALTIDPGDCDAQRYLGQIDAAEASWKPAYARFSSAVACYDRALARMAGELAGYEQDISGLSNGLIASLRTEIQETRTLRAISAGAAALTAKNSGIPGP
jgi:tetratricopeptide (TPR) repeat protein